MDSIDNTCRTPLMLAAATGLSQAVTLLVKAGADLTVTDVYGNTALHFAYAFSCMSIASYLENQQDDHHVENVNSMTPIDVSGLCRQKEFKPLIRFKEIKI